MAVLGLVSSPGILLAIPGAILIGYAFAAAGLAVTTYLRDFSDFQLIQLVMLPMYLFATTFYPLTTYPAPVRPLIQVLPLYQSIQLVARAGARGVHAVVARAGRLPERVRHDRARDRHAADDTDAAALSEGVTSPDRSRQEPGMFVEEHHEITGSTPRC